MTNKSNDVLVLVAHNPGDVQTRHLDNLQKAECLTEPTFCMVQGEGDYDSPAISENTVWKVFMTAPSNLVIYENGKTLMSEGLLEYSGTREGALRFLSMHCPASANIGWQYQYATDAADQYAGCRSVQRAGQGSIQSGDRNCIQRASTYSIQKAGDCSLQFCTSHCYQLAGSGSVQVCYWKDHEGKAHVRSRVVGVAEADRWYRTSNGNWLVATAIEVIAVEHKIRDLTKKRGCKCK